MGSLSVAVARLAKLRVGVTLTTDSTSSVMVLVTITASTTLVVFHLFWNLSDISRVVWEVMREGKTEVLVTVFSITSCSIEGCNALGSKASKGDGGGSARPWSCP